MAWTKGRCLGYLGEQHRWEEKVDGPWFNAGEIGIRTRTGSVVFLDREVDEISRTGTGKIRRLAPREQLVGVGATYLGASPGRHTAV